MNLMAEYFSLTHGAASPPEVRRTTLTLANFGRIKDATVSISPMTILVGKNNTGKSYLASILWSVLGSTLGISPSAKLRMAPPIWFRNYVKSADINSPALEITANRVLPHFNRWLERNKNALVSDLLSLETATIGALKLSFEGSIWLSVRAEGPEWLQREAFTNIKTRHWGLSWSEIFEPEKVGGSLHGHQGDVAELLFGIIVEKLVSKSLYNVWGSAVYIPAARTGLVLALHEITSSVMSSFGIQNGPDDYSRFSRPVIDFLRSLVRYSDRDPTRTASVADFLQQNIFDGQLTVEGKGVPTFLYQPEGSETKLPMHAVSSMITELTPVLSILRTSYLNGGLIIEEPEAHLHLSAQRCVARALIKISNMGIPVVITTHSDTFLQQINLMMHIATHPDRDAILERLGYAQDETLHPSNVEAYEFLSENGRTSVCAAQKTPSGFVISSLNETLINLANDVMSVVEE